MASLRHKHMRHKFKIFTGSLILFYILTSCQDHSKHNNKNASKETKDAATIKALVTDWNKANTTKDVAEFHNLYRDTVLYYGTLMDKSECIENKQSFFKKNPDFHQQIQGDVKLDFTTDTEVQCRFYKRVTIQQKTTDYPAYLVFRKVGKTWKITTEGDRITDKNLSKTKPLKVNIPDNATKGDFNGDGVPEYMWLVKPDIDADGMDCVGNCTSYIMFSDPNIPSITIENCIGGIPENEGDLNKNGSDEIGLLPAWFTSCWKSYHVWTLNNDKWTDAVKPFSTHCNQWEAGVKPIEIDSNKVGHVIIRYSEFDGDDILTKSKSVPIAK